jgi:hypothetical protein
MTKEFRDEAHANHASHAPVDDRLDELRAAVIACWTGNPCA